MILFKIDLKCITIFPLKGDTPWTVDMNAITLWASLKAVKIKSWNVLNQLTIPPDLKHLSVLGIVFANPAEPCEIGHARKAQQALYFESSLSYFNIVT
jgi:hypothetical protein